MSKYGVLCPIASLNGNHGIGDFGACSISFIKYLKRNDFSYWQILPLNPLGPGNSPYLTISMNAIDVRYISLDILYKEGLIKEKPIYKDDIKDKVLFYESLNFKLNYLYEAYKNFIKDNKNKLFSFIKKNPWTIYYATFLIFHSKNGDKAWNEWEIEDRDYFINHSSYPKEHEEEILFHIFNQYIAFKQWNRVMKFANKNGIKIIGDIPFYVGFDSADVWCNKKYFMIDKRNEPITVGGVPPDYFSSTGQLWGNPCYNFKTIKKDNYSFLINRIKSATKTCNILRLDHFRAFYDYWEIPANEETAINGRWRRGVGKEFFDTLFASLKDINIIAEDLGLLSPGVPKLRKKLGLPGMNVFQFTILDKNFKDRDDLVVYSGTHDNDTLLGWYDSLSDYDKERLTKIIKKHKREDIYSAMIRYIKDMNSKITIFSIVDILGLPSLSRLNTPGTVGSPNFEFRLLKNMR